MTKAELAMYQMSSLEHIAFSITENCPLRCAHCIVSSGDKDVELKSLSEDIALNIASQMNNLKNLGLRRISFTGGEPVLEKVQVNILSKAAKANGINTTIITSGYFAKDMMAAEEMAESMMYIDNWHISSDIYHQEFVDRQNVVNMVKAVVKKGKRAVVRMTVSKFPKESEIILYNWLLKNLHKDANIFVQPIIKGGRADDIETELSTSFKPDWPCVTSGMAIRCDGSISPCCGGLINNRNKHPFIYENAFQVGVPEAYKIWRNDHLLKLIQAAGFLPLIGWIKEFAPEHPVLKHIPRHPCIFCFEVWRYPGISDFIRKKVQEPENIEKINSLYNIVFNNKLL